ncbi:MAG: hypothetical protein LBU23_00400 [Planctomycetota bacterium]|nr:hypothetical protein [Planctomycetota bacterium]
MAAKLAAAFGFLSMAAALLSAWLAVGGTLTAIFGLAGFCLGTARISWPPMETASARPL